MVVAIGGMPGSLGSIDDTRFRQCLYRHLRDTSGLRGSQILVAQGVDDESLDAMSQTAALIAFASEQVVRGAARMDLRGDGYSSAHKKPPGVTRAEVCQ